MAERDDAGRWQTVGEPVPDADFPEQVLAYEYPEKRNKAYLRGFDWTMDPSMAWVAVQFSEPGRLKAHTPHAAPAELAPVTREVERHREVEQAEQVLMAWG